MFVTYNEIFTVFVLYKLVLVSNIAHCIMKLITEPKLVSNNWWSCVDVSMSLLWPPIEIHK